MQFVDTLTPEPLARAETIFYLSGRQGNAATAVLATGHFPTIALLLDVVLSEGRDRHLLSHHFDP